MQNYRGTQLTASVVRNRGYVSPWGGANWLRQTSVNHGTTTVPRCTTVYCDVIAVHRDNFHPGSSLVKSPTGLVSAGSCDQFLLPSPLRKISFF